MQCSCGGETSTNTHEVKMLETAIEWFGDDKNISTSDLPLTIHQERCKGCGRVHAFAVVGNEILRRG